VASLIITSSQSLVHLGLEIERFIFTFSIDIYQRSQEKASLLLHLTKIEYYLIVSVETCIDTIIMPTWIISELLATNEELGLNIDTDKINN
jgi:hypothetical protein